MPKKIKTALDEEKKKKKSKKSDDLDELADLPIDDVVEPEIGAEGEDEHSNTYEMGVILSDNVEEEEKIDLKVIPTETLSGDDEDDSIIDEDINTEDKDDFRDDNFDIDNPFDLEDEPETSY